MAPSTVPMMVASNAATRPTKIDISAPLTAFCSTSRPHLSPPNGSVSARWRFGHLDLGGALFPFLVARRQRIDVGEVHVRAPWQRIPWCQPWSPRGSPHQRGKPGSRRKRRLPSTSPWRSGPGIGAEHHQEEEATTTTSETMPTLSRLSRRHASVHRPGDAWCSGAATGLSGQYGTHPGAPYLNTTRGSTTLYITSTTQVDEHRDHGEIDRHRLDHGKVAAIHRRHDFAAQPGNREERLQQERADKNAGQRDADVGEDRDHGVAQHVLHHHRFFAQPLGARGAHVVLIDFIEEETAVQPSAGAKPTNTASMIGSGA